MAEEILLELGVLCNISRTCSVLYLRKLTILLHDLVLTNDKVGVLDCAWLFFRQRIHDICRRVAQSLTKLADNIVVELLSDGGSVRLLFLRAR